VTWRRFNMWLTLACLIALVGACALWWEAWRDDFIGDTRFIGHVSMLAIVLGTAGMFTGALAAWRADA
jgi:Na+-transporting NADH:ubiquinone oxidoreductase subunit NqrB